MKKLEKLSKTKFNVLDRSEMTKIVGGSTPCRIALDTSEHTSTYQGLLGWDHDSRPEYSEVADCFYA
jgi:natural product precursor